VLSETPSVLLPPKQLPFKIIRKKIQKYKKFENSLPSRPVKPSGEQLKNLVKNYGKFCTKFTLHPIISKNLERFELRNKKEQQSFLKFIGERKNVNSIQDFRSLLLVQPGDPKNEKNLQENFSRDL